MDTVFPLERFRTIPTPFYYYDTELLDRTLTAIEQALQNYPGYEVHYAIKANNNRRLLKQIASKGYGADCVSGGEIQASIEAGFPANKIVFAGVGKSDEEIKLALQHQIFCFNVESIPELEVINQLAQQENQRASVCLRINPNVGAHTHEKITTGLNENKFGIAMDDLNAVFSYLHTTSQIDLIGIHFHIGSQILDMEDFKQLALRINELQDIIEQKGLKIEHINVGGGLGIDYDTPHENPIPDFKSYFDTYHQWLKLRPYQKLHFELGRSIIAQCGSLITKVLYVKQGQFKQFAILDAGMTDLIRPAMYHAHHHIVNLSSTEQEEQYDVVGPICESSDTFAKDYSLPRTSRGDILVIRSAGAYGESMSSQYNCRKLPESYFSDII